MNFSDPFPESLIAFTGEQAFKELQHKKNMETKLNEASSRQNFFAEINNYLKKNWVQHILALLNKESQLCKVISADNQSVKEALESIRNMAQEKAVELQKQFPAYLEKACEKNGLPLDKESRDPQYTFERGFFTLIIDHHKGRAKLSNYEGRLHEFPADVDAVVEYVQKEHKRVFGKQFDGQKFIKKLRNNYLAIIKKDGLNDGYALPVRRITTRLGKNEKGFRTDEFIVHLSKLVVEGPTEIDKRRLDLQQTKDSNQGIYLHGLAGRGYIGYITFKEV